MLVCVCPIGVEIVAKLNKVVPCNEPKEEI